MSDTQPSRANHVLKLKAPRSVAVYDNYQDASRAVDYLADNNFPVETLAIVGTDLKSYEKVTGTMNWGKVIAAGFLQGTMWALMFSLLMVVFTPNLPFFSVLLMSILGFGIIGVVMGATQYGMRGGQRDFTSASGVIAAHYEVMAEVQTVAYARELLGRGHDIPQPTTDLSAMPPPQFPPVETTATAQSSVPEQATLSAAPAAGPEYPVPGVRPDDSVVREPDTEPNYGQMPYGAFTDDGTQGIGTPPRDIPTEFEQPDAENADDKTD